MYDEHYGLTGRPFQLTPDPKFWFETATHRKAMAYLGYGLVQGEGFIVVTGDIGAGKTTLVGHLMETIDHGRLNAITLVSTAIEADDLLRLVATSLRVDPAGLAKAELLTAIERGLHAVARTGKRTLLIVDEAQALPISALEELRMLSNFQAGGHALLQIVLLGQPEFRDRLHGSDRLEQLRQRVIAIHHLEPMEEHEVADYIAHRLSVVGWTGRPDFAADAFGAFYEGSGGVPRRLNQLASRVLLHASVEDLGLIDAQVVRDVLRDLHADLPMQASTVDEAPVVMAPEAVAPVSVAQMPVVEHQSLATETDVVALPQSVLPQTPEPEPVVAQQSEPEPGPQPPIDVRTAERLAELEARVEQQDEALRRVLTLLVDWVEKDTPRSIQAPDKPTDQASGAVAEYAPIRGAAAWYDAA